MNKRGQFYIVAAVLIIAIVIGMVGLKNYTTSGKSYTRVYDLKKELKLETGQVIDYGIFNKKDSDELVENWSIKYYEHSRTGGIVGDWVFIYGNESTMNALYLNTTSSGEVFIQVGDEKTSVPGQDSTTFQRRKLEIGQSKSIKIRFLGYDYEFELKEGQNFYFVIKSEGAVTQG